MKPGQTSADRALSSVLAAVASLTPDQRLTLAPRLLSCLEAKRTLENDQAREREIRGRIAGYDAGGAHAFPASESFAELERRLAVTEGSGQVQD